MANILKPMQAIRNDLRNLLSAYSRDIKKELVYKILNAFDLTEKYAQSVAIRAITAELELKGQENSLTILRDQLNDVRNGMWNTSCESSYANKLKNNTKQGETLIIKPKDGKNIEGNEIKNAIKTNIDPVELEVGISKMKTIKNGLTITCETKEESEKIQKEFESKMGINYEIKHIERKKPKIKIVGIDEELTKDELKRKIKNQNSAVKMSDMEIVVIKKMKTKYMAIVEVDAGVYDIIMKMGKLKIGWCLCPIYEYVSVLRCYKCFGYNHKQGDCTRDQCCARCGGKNHQTSECKETVLKCVNCEAMNRKLNLNLDCGHTVYDIKCPVYVRNIERRRERVEYQK